MGQKRETKTTRRHEKIFNEYVRVLKDKGEMAPRYKKQEIYEEVAENLDYSSVLVRTVVCKRLKQGSVCN